MAPRIVSHVDRLRNEAGRPELDAAADDAAILVAGYHDHGRARMLRAQEHQPGEALHAGHVEVEKDQVDLRALAELLGDLLERSGLDDGNALHQARNGLAQGTANKRVVVGYHDESLRSVRHLVSPYAEPASCILLRIILPV